MTLPEAERLAQVSFAMASSTYAADFFVTAVLFAQNIAAQLFASDAAFLASTLAHALP